MSNHEVLKKRIERAVGDQFITLHNSESGHNFAFKDSPRNDPPDLIYEDVRASRTLLLEVSTAYYNQAHAKWEWNIIRGIDTREISESPVIVAPDDSLREFLRRRIIKKCQDLNGAKRSRPGDFAFPISLVIAVNAGLTTSGDIQDFIRTCYLAECDTAFGEVWLLTRETVDKGRIKKPGEQIQDIPWDEIFGSVDRRFRFYPRD